MNRYELDLLVECLGSHRRTFYYFRDKFCLDLLDRELAGRPCESIPLRVLRQGRWAKFLSRPLLKPVLAGCGDGQLHRHQLPLAWPQDPLAFNLTVDHWSQKKRYWQQTSRKGSSLVLQLNFDRRHNREYERLVSPFPDEPRWRNCSSKVSIRGRSAHPVNRDRGYTMSWARLDIDLDRGEVLIEELQTDWLRNCQALASGFQRVLADGKGLQRLRKAWPQFRGHYDQFVEYARDYLRPYRQIWSEASLTAAIEFIRNELGEMDIYYHSYESGAALKGIRYRLPPRSLYSQLPEKFGFCLTEDVPGFLGADKFSQRCMKAMKVPVKFYRL
ncbi:hypothetical protein [Microbulbifer guangxiensis]|uniref:hypothetical protein n=1 Tax=Microbulbifer guangxiensis TaxID=2904249 RepID=UPI001F16CE29|nr:hypothetical protein [Microbulbifer guangxiensis]